MFGSGIVATEGCQAQLMPTLLQNGKTGNQVGELNIAQDRPPCPASPAGLLKSF